MATRTWLPTLFRLTHLVCLYMTRWSTQIRNNLPEDARPAFDTFRTACSVWLEVLEPLIVEGP